MVLEAERGTADANILTLPDALWWAITNITTVGYGDRYPTTAGSRAIGAVLMVLGIALFGFIAASVSAMFVRKDVSKDVDPQLDEIGSRLDRIEQRLVELHEHLVPATQDDDGGRP
jgi:voltage-gated potassium channel